MIFNNLKKVEQRLFRKNNTTNSNIHLAFLDENDKNNICTCKIY